MAILIQQATIIDGTGNDSYSGNVVIDEGRIKRIFLGEIDDYPYEQVIDARGKYLSPGFVDSHSHADWNAIVSPHHEIALLQGITTVIAGQCGLGAAPLCDTYAFWGNEIDIEKYYGSSKKRFDSLADFYTMLKSFYGKEMPIHTMRDYFNAIKQEGISYNLAQLAGHNNIRAQVMGSDTSRTASDEEVQQMCVVLEGLIDDGCLGMSAGLDYDSGMFCDTRELVELARVLKKRDAIYVSHVRIVHSGSDGMPFKGEIIGILEVLEIAEKTGVKAHISHMLPNNYHTDDEHAYIKAHDAIWIKHIIEKARAKGLDISYDVMVGENGGHEYSKLVSLFKPWLKEAGSKEAFQVKLSEPEFVNRLFETVRTHQYPPLSMMWEPTLDDWFVVSKCKDPSYIGKTVRQISRERESDHIEAMVHLLQLDSDCDMYTRIAGVKPEFLKVITDYDYAFPSSDASGFDVGHKMSSDYDVTLEPSWLAHNFAIRYLLEYGAGRVEDTIKRMTWAPLVKHGVLDRGVIKEGYWADLVLFNLEALAYNRDYSLAKGGPEGIEAVFVNGILTVSKGKHTKVRKGQILGG
jgi:N-acyl-D-amino-acid deacylase